MRIANIIKPKLCNTLFILTVLIFMAAVVLPTSLSTQTTWANGNTVIYSYDDAGRLTGVAYPNGGTIDYDYDNAGNLEERVTTAGVWSPWIYDTSPKDFLIQVGEFLNALADYLGSNIGVSQLLQVLGLYL